MNGMQAAARLVDALEIANIPYLVVGSLSSSFYGIARSTYDANFVVAAPIADVQRAVIGLGDDFRIESQLSFESRPERLDRSSTFATVPLSSNSFS